MKIFFSTIPLLLLSACSNADNSNQYEFNDCGKSKLNGKIIQKKCATQDIQAKKISKDYTPKILQTIIGAGHTINHEEQPGFILKFKNEEFNMQSHIWDFSKQDASLLVFKGHDSIISNGVIFGEKIILGGNYIPPNFTTNNQPNNISLDTVGFLYANNQYDCNSVGGNNCDDIRFNIIENLYINKIKIAANSFSLSSWGGGIINSTFLINNITIEGSKAFFKNNQIFSQAKLLNKKKSFDLEKINKSIYIDSSQQIFPDQSEAETAIPATLYVKFSPDTVIDGNTFTLTKRNDQAYAIVLDHSPRVRIINNTFNGFKVPILMDQWSSIVDEKGNVINPNQFSGDVTMNRKGEIVKK